MFAGRRDLFGHAGNRGVGIEGGLDVIDRRGLRAGQGDRTVGAACLGHVGVEAGALVGHRQADDVAAAIGHHHFLGAEHAQALVGVLHASDFLAIGARVLVGDAEIAVGAEAEPGVAFGQFGQQRFVLWRDGYSWFCS